MLRKPKISPLIPATIALSSSYNHQDFLPKHLKSHLNLYLDSLLEYQEDQSHPKIKEQKSLLKIFKGLKCIRKIQQDDLVLHKMKLPLSKTKYLIKKAQRIALVDIQDKLTSSKEFPARLNLWLKLGKNLKDINFQFVPQLVAFEKSIVLFEREIQQCLKYLPQHRNLATFKIRLPNSCRKVIESLLQFQRYPSSLKNLAIYQQRAVYAQKVNGNLMVSAFSRLKSLESLTLSGPYLFNTAEVLLDNVPSLSKIKKLNVQVFESQTFWSYF